MFKKILRYIITLFLLSTILNIHATESIKSVNVHQEGKNIVITYQLSEKSYISVSVSTDSGHSFKTLKSVTGDVGNDILPGNRKIVWNVLDEYEKFNFSDVCFRVVPLKNNGHEYVDLGLPSGILWATYNVGASKPEEGGDYFAWGETKPKARYSWDTYKWCNGNEKTLKKYCTDSEYGRLDNKTTLDLLDDAANANWGGDWRIPTKSEQDELRNTSYTTWTWTTQNGVKGYKVTSKTNDNSIFLPAVGAYSGSNLIHLGSNGFYLNSSLYTNDTSEANIMSLDSDGIDLSYASRFYGLSIRAVLPVGFTYSISFDSNGGNGMMQPITHEYTEVFTLPENKLTRHGYEFICWNTRADGTGINYMDGAKFRVSSDITLYAQWYKEETNITHEYVDLGLPSGLLWATCNVGASRPEETGYFFSWGETKPKARYSWDTYKWCNGNEKTLKKYCTDSEYGRLDNKTTLDLLDDAANANWGGDWRIPTKSEQDELRNTSYTTWTWTTQNGVKGYKVTSKANGNSIFLPAAGVFGGFDLSFMLSRGYYWSGSLKMRQQDDVSCFEFYLYSVDVKCLFRYYGLPIRPVFNK